MTGDHARDGFPEASEPGHSDAAVAISGTPPGVVAVKVAGKDTIPLTATRRDAEETRGEEETEVLEPVADGPPEQAAGTAPGPEQAPEPFSVRADVERPWPFWDLLDGGNRAGGILPCGRCGKVHEDEHAAGYPRMHAALRCSAMLAGWALDEDSTWCCPDCLGEPRESGPALATDSAPDAYGWWVSARKEARIRAEAFDAGLDEHDEDALLLVRARIGDFRERYEIPELEEVPA